MSIDHIRLIAALRDTATKATETKEVTRPNYDINPTWRSGEAVTVTEHVEAYSKDWIAGRLLGMADTLEALISEPTQ
jgi:hypothetical protein